MDSIEEMLDPKTGRKIYQYFDSEGVPGRIISRKQHLVDLKVQGKLLHLNVNEISFSSKRKQSATTDDSDQSCTSGQRRSRGNQDFGLSQTRKVMIVETVDSDEIEDNGKVEDVQGSQKVRDVQAGNPVREEAADVVGVTQDSGEVQVVPQDSGGTGDVQGVAKDIVKAGDAHGDTSENEGDGTREDGDVWLTQYCNEQGSDIDVAQICAKLADVKCVNKASDETGAVMSDPTKNNDNVKEVTIVTCSSTQRNIKKQNQPWVKITPSGSKSLTSSPASMMFSPALNSGQVDMSYTFDNLIPAKKPPQAAKVVCTPPILFCSQMSSLDDSLPVPISPGVSINILKSFESKESRVESELRMTAGAYKKGGIVLTTVSVSDLLSEEEPGDRRGKNVSSGDKDMGAAEIRKDGSVGKEKKSPGWSNPGIAIGEMAVSVPQMGGKCPALCISSEAGEIEKETEEMEIQALNSIDLKDSHNLNDHDVAEEETETDSFPSVICTSICSREDKSFKVLCSDSPAHGGWVAQEERVGKERGVKVVKLVALKEERLASFETEVAREESGSISGRKASFNLDVSTCSIVEDNQGETPVQVLITEIQKLDMKVVYDVYSIDQEVELGGVSSQKESDIDKAEIFDADKKNSVSIQIKNEIQKRVEAMESLKVPAELSGLKEVCKTMDQFRSEELSEKFEISTELRSKMIEVLMKEETNLNDLCQILGSSQNVKDFFLNDVVQETISLGSHKTALKTFPPDMKDNLCVRLVEEIKVLAPNLLSLLIKFCCKPNEPVTEKQVRKIIQLSSQLASCVNQKNSCLQKLLSLKLKLSSVSNTGIDFLHDLGITQSSRTLQRDNDYLASINREYIVEQLKGRSFSFLVDNLDKIVNGNLVHFTSVILIADRMTDNELNSDTKNSPILFEAEYLKLDERSETKYMAAVTHILGHLMLKLWPSFDWIKGLLDPEYKHELSKQAEEATFWSYIALLPLSEQKNDEMVQILDFLNEFTLEMLWKTAEEPEVVKSWIEIIKDSESSDQDVKSAEDNLMKLAHTKGIPSVIGDQLTYERAFIAKRLRKGSITKIEMFDLLQLRMAMFHELMAKVRRDFTTFLPNLNNTLDKGSLAYFRARLSKLEITNDGDKIKKGEKHSKFLNLYNILLNAEIV